MRGTQSTNNEHRLTHSPTRSSVAGVNKYNPTKSSNSAKLLSFDEHTANPKQPSKRDLHRLEVKEKKTHAT